MKVLLINPPQRYLRGEQARVGFPLGLGYIAAVLREYDVEVLDCIGEGTNIRTPRDCDYILGLRKSKVRDRIKKIMPDIALISCQFASQYDLCVQISEDVKSINPDTKIIIGGNHASAIDKILEKEQTFDFIVSGEGEKSIRYLLNCIQKGKSPSKGKLIRKESIKNIDKISFPQWNLFPIKNYINSKIRHSFLPAKRTIEVITSRGCPYDCCFCTSNKTGGRRWRARSVENIVLEIKTLIEKYNVEEIHFVDDNIAFDKKRFEILCKEIKKLHIRWTVPNGINVSHLDNNIIDIMKSSGCYALFLPIETGSQRIRDRYMNKPYKDPKQIIDCARQTGLYTVGFFMIGFENEKREDIRSTINLAQKLGLDEVHFSIVSAIPGSEYFTDVSKNRKIRFNNSKVANETKYLKKNEIETLRNEAYLKFELSKFFKHPFSINMSVQYLKYIRYIKYYIGW